MVSVDRNAAAAKASSSRIQIKTKHQLTNCTCSSARARWEDVQDVRCRCVLCVFGLEIAGPDALVGPS